MAAPPLLPGCMVAWFDRADVAHYAMVVQFEHRCIIGGDWYHAMTIIHEGRIRTMSFRDDERDSRWRVLHGHR